MSSAHARIAPGACSPWNSRVSCGRSWRATARGAVLAPRMVGSSVASSACTCCSTRSRISRTSSRGRPAGSGISRLLELRGYERARVLAADGDRPVGAQLHLHRHLLRLLAGEIDSALGHDLHNLRPDLLRRVVPRGLGADVARRVVVEERLGHLRAPGVVVADEEHVFHAASSPPVFARFSNTSWSPG